MRARRLVTAGVALALIVVAGAAIVVLQRDGDAGGDSAARDTAALLAPATERRTGTDAQIETLQSRLSKQQPDATILAELGAAYLQKARETGNPAFYGKAEEVLARSLKLEPENGDALNGMGQLALARHQFREALDWGERAVRVNPYRAANHGVAGDALVELGRYDEAVVAVQKMVDTRPDLASYARVSYLRELHGDIPGAIEAMQRAVAAGGPAAENTAYVRVQLGNLYFNSNRPDEAERHYQFALQRVADYGPARAGLAQVRAAHSDDAAAIELLTRAVEAMPLPEYVIALGDLYARTGRAGEAARQYDLVRALEKLFAANGADVDVETALFDADHGIDLPNALARARAGYERRPSIHAADVLAWTLHQSGRSQEAEPYMREALRLGTKDALKLYHAGMIADALGKSDEARAYLDQALAINPHFSLLHAEKARIAVARGR